MDKIDLFYNVLKKLTENKVLKDIILIGSWVLHVYKDYFHSDEIPIKRTLDIDFLIPNPPKIKHKNIMTKYFLFALKIVSFCFMFHHVSKC